MGRERILVIDDDPTVTKSCHRVLTAEGYEVDVTESGQEGLDRALKRDFDLVLTDLMMPDLDGMNLVRTLAGERPGTPIVIVTGYGTVPSAVEATRLGVKDYVEKPFTPDRIAQAVSSALASAAAEGAGEPSAMEAEGAERLCVPISASAHHVHLSQDHVEALFGRGHELTWLADLSQPGQFACKEQLGLVGPKAGIDRVRVLGPARGESQVEIARTEQFKLGLDVPVRMSGDLDGTPGVLLEGAQGRINLDRGVICAARHIHMSPQEAEDFEVDDREVVNVRVAGNRPLTFADVIVRVKPDFRLDMHIDTDEANAAGLGTTGQGYLEQAKKGRRPR